MKEVYYYTKENGYRITACLLIKNNCIMARGVALCSPRDNFCKSIGREIALGRARKALNNQISCARNTIRRPDVCLALPSYISSKCMYRPRHYTNFEFSLLEKVSVSPEKAAAA